MKQYSFDQFCAMVDICVAHRQEAFGQIPEEWFVRPVHFRENYYILEIEIPILIEKGIFGQGPDDTEDRYKIQTVKEVIYNETPAREIADIINKMFNEADAIWMEERNKNM